MSNETEFLSKEDLLSDVDHELILVNRYDTNDILVGTQRFILFVDKSPDSNENEYILSSVSKPV